MSKIGETIIDWLNDKSDNRGEADGSKHYDKDGSKHGYSGAHSESNSEKEYRKHGWNVEYANESEEGYSKKA